MKDDDTPLVVVLDYTRASEAFRRYLPLKLATLAWVVLLFGVAFYGIA